MTVTLPETEILPGLDDDVTCQVNMMYEGPCTRPAVCRARVRCGCQRKVTWLCEEHRRMVEKGIAMHTGCQQAFALLEIL